MPRCRQYRTVETGALVISATSSVVSRSVPMSIAISISSRRPVAAGLTRHRRTFAAVTAKGGRRFSTGTGGNCLVSAVIALRGHETCPVARSYWKPLRLSLDVRDSAAMRRSVVGWRVSSREAIPGRWTCPLPRICRAAASSRPTPALFA